MLAFGSKMRVKSFLLTSVAQIVLVQLRVDLNFSVISTRKSSKSLWNYFDIWFILWP